MIEAFIFDIDGTLIDSVDFHAQAWQKAFEKYGKHIAFEKVREQIGKGADNLLPEFFSKNEIKEFGDEMTKWRGDVFKNEYLSQIRAFPQVRELFEKLKAGGKQFALASSAKKDELEEYEKIAGIEDLVKKETSSDEAKNSKPDPDIIEAALKKLGNPALEKVLMIGDSPYDAEAAGKAGIKTIGVLCGGFLEKDLIQAGCIEVYKDPADLLTNYEKVISI